MSKTTTIVADKVRACIARKMTKWDREEVIDRLYDGKGEGNFVLAASSRTPGSETLFDVAQDGRYVYVSVMCFEHSGAAPTNNTPGADTETVEILFDPLRDGIGFVQFIAGNGGMRTEASHWPYRDEANNRFRDPSWHVDVIAIKERPERLRFYFFRFELDQIQGGDWVGFNVCRSQMHFKEDSSWSLCSGYGFPDAGCFGRLWLRKPPVSCGKATVSIQRNGLRAVALDGVTAGKGVKLAAKLIDPAGSIIARWRPQAMKNRLVLRGGKGANLRPPGRYRLVLEAVSGKTFVAVEPAEFHFDHAGAKAQTVQFQGTYDIPDHVGNVVYSPQDLDKEIRWYKDRGIERLFWIDYAMRDTILTNEILMGPLYGSGTQKSAELFKEDFLFSAARSARKAGLEFFTVFKPFEFLPGEPFLDQHPEAWMRRNPAWRWKPALPVTTVRIYQRDERPFPCATANVRLWFSGNNKSYAPADIVASESVIQRHESFWSPRGAMEIRETRPVRCLEFEGLQLDAPYLAVTFEGCDPNVVLRNREYLVAEIINSTGKAVPYYPKIGASVPPQGFQFDMRKHCGDSNIEQLFLASGEKITLAFCLIQNDADQCVPAFPDPCSEETQQFWLTKTRRGLDAGADGVCLRLAHHVNYPDMLAFSFAEPVIEEFRRRTGRDPECRNEDFALVQKIRGDAWTEFVRRASQTVRAAGKKFMVQIERRMVTAPGQDAFMYIDWQWRRWIEEDLLDELDLKYIGPDSAIAWREIMPLARKHGVKVNYVSHEADPRGRPNSIREIPAILRRARSAGVNGFNLYEMWIYRRMTDRGYPLTRGCGEAIIRETRKAIDEP